jgi:hypothetical protein
MDSLIKKEKEIINNNAVVKEERIGVANELVPGRLSTLTDSVRNEIQKLSILEVIA